ncbi:radical SAM/SPASM domain-containing protein [Erysipelothrix urinaevulpis]|uniref:radical SAM/SPASM domain-containing protein n=1 Tax=Erysipelothrix urinaevulpis TaxID=2683717 RepID=UPI0013589DEB|nr:radical SAM protein [Erysipelothrix urinaevulpis]
MRQFSVLIKPASSVCNLKCKYCFYNDISSLRDIKSYGKMTSETTYKMIDNIFKSVEEGDYLTLAFQGGEPTIDGLDYFQTLVDYVEKKTKSINVSYSIQTNGTLITDEWCKFFKKYNFLVGLSIDGPKEFHDQGRVTWLQKGSYDKVIHTKQLFDLYSIEYNVLTVLSKEIARHPNEIFDFLLQEKIEYVQFIPCLEDFNLCNSHLYNLTPELFSSFYDCLIDRWLKELEKKHYLSIKLFDDIFNLFVKGQETACGMLGRCQIQFVIEADGSVFPCDFYVLDDYYLGNITELTLAQLSAQPKAWEFIFSKKSESLKCGTCPYQKMCGNGCKRMNKTMYVSEDGTFCGYQHVLDTFTSKIPQIILHLNKIIQSSEINQYD